MAGRLTQFPRETIIEPDDAQARVSQFIRETIIAAPSGTARVSQYVREVIVESTESPGGSGIPPQVIWVGF